VTITDQAIPADAVPIAEGLFTMGPDPRLIGGRSQSSGVHTFPYQARCPKTGADDMERVELSPTGTLWSWTIQNFPPKRPPYNGPEPFVPYGLGYVELPDQVKVEALLTTNDASRLRIGMQMRLVLIPYITDDQGRTVVTFAFEPAE
jgi:uncharacterized OB-fold protein